MFVPDTGRAMRAIRLLEVAEELGLEPEALRDAAGIAASDLADEDHRVPSSRILDLWAALVENHPDPDIGLHVGSRIDPRQAGVLGYAIMHSSTLGRALRRFARFSRILSTRLDVDLEEGPEQWSIVSRLSPPNPGFRPPTDEAIAGIMNMMRGITGRQIDPVEVHLPYSRPEDMSVLRRVLRSEFRFDRPQPSLILRASDMASPVLGAEAKLAGYLDRLAEQELAALPRSDTFANRAGRTIWRHLSEGQPTLDSVAREIGVSSRTLQRRLREEETSFAQVIENLRRQMATLLLADENLAVYEVAYLLGYADPSAFFRAFRRWHGLSPAEYRQQAN